MQHVSDIYVKGTGILKVEKDWGYYQTGTYEDARLCINDNDIVYEITGMDSEGRWSCRRILK